MQCPTDGATLVMSERSGIEIDYCPTCRGVWLDRGELDKIIERSLGQPGPAAAPAPAPYARDDRRDERPREERHRDERPRYEEQPRYQSQGHPRKRKESWLSELFD